MTQTSTKVLPKAKRVNVPTVLQMEAVECGAAALKIILDYYKKYVPLAELRRVCGVSRNGSKASNIIKAARIYGLEAEGYKYEIEDVYKLELPYIVFWHFNHFIVVAGFDQNWVYLSDPATGRRRISHKEFDQGYTGVTLIFQPSPEFQKGGEKPSIYLSLYKRLSSSLDSALVCGILGILLIVPRAAIPVFSGEYLDEVIANGRPWLLPILWGIGFAGILNFFLQEAQLKFLRRLQIKLAVEMSGNFMWHLMFLPMSFYVQRSAGDISSRVRYNDRVANILSGQLATTAIGILTMGIYGIILLTYDVPLTLIIIVLAAINFITLQLVSRQRVDTNMSLKQDYGKIAGLGMSGLQNIETIKASGLETEFFSRWSGHYTKGNNNKQQLDSQTQILQVLPSLVSNITNTVIIVLGGLKVMQGSLTLGGFIAFKQLSGQFLQPINSLVNLGQQLQELVGDINRLDDVLVNELDQELTRENFSVIARGEIGKARLEGYVEFKNVNFAYSNIDPPLINNFNLSLKPGQRVAIVGSTGSGKSTIAKLVTGLYQPTSGEILLDGKLRKDLPGTIISNSLAMVDQDIVLFAGTVRDNLTLWDQTISDQDLIKACQDAVIHDDLLALPNGYESDLLEGAVNLSGGQRQRLEIARALVNNPSILVLDEATSALDAKVEMTITENLRRRGCTCIIIAHRLSTIRDCDEILVLLKGKVVQRGTHEQLGRSKGYYAELLHSEGETLSA